MTGQVHKSDIKGDMYGIKELKKAIAITDEAVECPVTDCATKVKRRRRGEPLRNAAFFCPEHKIYISPSTFDYEHEQDNLLWHEAADRKLLAALKPFKRESRLARDNSEDALTWNVFRYLERSNRLAEFLGSAIGGPVVNPLPAYWSYSGATNGVCPSLVSAREQFGEAVARGTEPDLIIEANGKMIWIEAKLGSTNETSPSNPGDTKGYLSGGERWFAKAFVGDYPSVAVAARRYELMRLWLLGSWAATMKGCEFYLINMTREESREVLFKAHIAQLPHAQFLTASWEQFYRWLEQENTTEPDAARLLKYMQDKSAGYVAGRLAQAFSGLS
jgi:hypothetical protein